MEEKREKSNHFDGEMARQESKQIQEFTTGK